MPQSKDLILCLSTSFRFIILSVMSSTNCSPKQHFQVLSTALHSRTPKHTAQSKAISTAAAYQVGRSSKQQDTVQAEAKHDLHM